MRTPHALPSSLSLPKFCINTYKYPPQQWGTEMPWRIAALLRRGVFSI